MGSGMIADKREVAVHEACDACGVEQETLGERWRVDAYDVITEWTCPDCGHDNQIIESMEDLL